MTLMEYPWLSLYEEKKAYLPLCFKDRKFKKQTKNKEQQQQKK